MRFILGMAVALAAASGGAALLAAVHGGTRVDHIIAAPTVAEPTATPDQTQPENSPVKVVATPEELPIQPLLAVPTIALPAAPVTAEATQRPSVRPATRQAAPSGKAAAAGVLAKPQVAPRQPDISVGSIYDPSSDQQMMFLPPEDDLAARVDFETPDRNFLIGVYR